MGEMKKLRHHLIPIANRLEETVLAERLDEIEDDQSVSTMASGASADNGGGRDFPCTCASWLSLPKSMPESIILGLPAPRSQQGKGIVRRNHSQDSLVGLGQLGSSGGGFEHCPVGNLKTELSCLLGVSCTGRRESPWRLVQLPRNSMNGPTRSQSQGYWKASENKSSFSGLRKCSMGKVSAMPVRGAAFDPAVAT